MVVISGPGNGIITAINPITGEVEYTPDLGFSGIDVFIYSVCDDDGACDTAIVTIEVEANLPPDANNDSATTDEGDPVVIDVLINDVDPDGFLVPSTVTVISPPSNGGTSVNPVTGEVTYTPNPGFAGVDLFIYEVCDNDGDCDTAIVNITVNPNQPPIAVDDLDTTPLDTPVVVDVLINDFDIDGTIDPTSVTVLFGPGQGGTSVNPVTGEVTYTPNPGFTGVDLFVYEVCDDDGDCDTANVTITVEAGNSPPFAINDSAVTDQNDPVVIDVVLNDFDTDGFIDPTTVTVISGPNNGGTAVNPVTGEVTYTPDPGFTGIDTFDYEVCDNEGACDTATVTITVNPNQPPIAVDDFDSTDENDPVTVDVLANDTDVDGVLVPGSVIITSPAGNGLLSVNPVNGEITYTPDPGFTGVDTFEYEVCDDDSECDTATVTITVTANQPPVANDDADTTDENSPVTVDVLLNDFDVDGVLDPSTVVVTVPTF